MPILIYHVILAAPPGAPFPGLYVTPALFAAQMHALAAAGYHAVTMDEMWNNWHHGTPLPRGKPIVLSFDNGYATQYTAALPVLRSLGWVGVENLQLSGLPPSQGGLSRRQVRALVSDGWELDTQGFSHADLITLSPSALHFQVAVARTTIRDRYHVAAHWFCYPSGHYNATVIAAVKAAGFRGSTTVVPGVGEPARGSLPAPAARGPRRYRAGVAAQRHRRLPRRSGARPVLSPGMTRRRGLVLALAAAIVVGLAALIVPGRVGEAPPERPPRGRRPPSCWPRPPDRRSRSGPTRSG